MKSYHDIDGDGGSRVLEQVEETRARIERNLAGVHRVLAVGSGKGGVGKSTLCLQIAATLQRRGHDVAILDADLNGPSQARLGGLPERPPLPSKRGLALPRTRTGIGVVSMGTFVPESRAVDFDSVASGESYVWRATKEFSFVGELLATVEWEELDWLLVDLPPGAERTFQYAEFLGPKAAFVLVTVPSDLARGVVARSVAALETAGARVLGVIENMKGYSCPDCGTIKPLFPETGGVELRVPPLGSVPFDPELAAIGDRGEAADPDGPAPRAIDDVVDGILEAWEKTS